MGRSRARRAAPAGETKMTTNLQSLTLAGLVVQPGQKQETKLNDIGTAHGHAILGVFSVPLVHGVPGKPNAECFMLHGTSRKVGKRIARLKMGDHVQAQGAIGSVQITEPDGRKYWVLFMMADSITMLPTKRASKKRASQLSGMVIDAVHARGDVNPLGNAAFVAAVQYDGKTSQVVPLLDDQQAEGESVH